MKYFVFNLYLIFFLCLLLPSIYVKGQNSHSITGSIKDSLSKENLFYVTIGILRNDTTGKVVANAVTDQQGRFTLQNIPAGDYLFKAAYVGYDVLSFPLSVKENQDMIDLGILLLKSQSMMLSGVTVIDKKPVYAIDGEKTLYNVSEDPGIQTGTAADALQNAPGVEVDIEGNITLRGVSSVEIWLNDKPSNMNAENLKTYIQQLPANSLQRIEVITNPSAKYSAKGTGGIINIITNGNIKKNSFISFGVRGSTTPNFSPWVSYVWANEKWSLNLYANGNFYIQKSNDIGHSITFDENKDTSSYATNSSKEYANNFSGGLYFNVDYAMDSMNTFSLWMGGYGNEYQYHLVSEDFRQEFIYNPGKYQYNTDQTGKTGNYGGYGGIWYEHKFNNEGHNIMADIGFNFWGQNGEGKFVRTYQNENSINKNKKTSLSSHSYYLNTSIEYVLPYYKDGELSIGVSGNFNNDKAVSHNDTLLFGTTETYISDQLRYLNSAEYNGGFDTYVTIQQKFGNFTLKGGLRTEYIHFNYQIYNSLTDNVNRGYWGLFPSLHLSYRTKSMHNFKLSYTRRVSNPSATQLTPFITYDEDTYSTGNPELLPTYTNSVEAGWNKYFDKFGSVGLSAYFKNSRDEINSLTDVIYSDVFGRMVSFSMPVNSGKSYRTGVDLNVTYRLKSFMNIRFYSNIYYAHSETVFREEDKVMTHNLAYSFRLNFWAKLWKVLEINASANYHSKTKNLFMETKPTYSINCGLRADFLNRKISVYLNVNDIFNWNKRVSNIDNPYYISYSSVKYNSRSISAGITFRFGKIELESQAKTEGRGTGESIGG